MDIVDKLLDLGGSAQQCRIHQQAAEEIERLRQQKDELANALQQLTRRLQTDFDGGLPIARFDLIRATHALAKITEPKPQRRPNHENLRSHN